MKAIRQLWEERETSIGSAARRRQSLKDAQSFRSLWKTSIAVIQTAAVHRPPAISALDNPDVLRAAEAGILKDLSGRMAEFPFWNNIYSGVRLALTSGNHVYGIPIGSNGFALFYNKKLLRDAGIQEPPRDWDELKQVAKALTKNPVYGFAFAATNTEECTAAFEPFLWSNRGSLLDITSGFQYFVQPHVMTNRGPATPSAAEALLPSS